MLVSIGIINYNNGEYLERAIRSCQNQFRGSHNVEIIVIDDSSTDDSVRLLQQFKDSITLISNYENKGAGFSAQKALENSKGKYFIRLDSDDFLSQFATGVFLNFLEENHMFDFVFGDLQVVDKFGRKLEVIDMSNRENLINHGAGILFRKEILDRLGGYDVSLRHGEDIDLMLRLLTDSKMYQHLPLRYYRYYRHDKNKSDTINHANAKRDLREKYGF
jgi:glycosyltransferase involved in cell wall biosynthesis